MYLVAYGCYTTECIQPWFRFLAIATNNLKVGKICKRLRRREFGKGIHAFRGLHMRRGLDMMGLHYRQSRYNWTLHHSTCMAYITGHPYTPEHMYNTILGQCVLARHRVTRTCGHIKFTQSPWLENITIRERREGALRQIGQEWDRGAVIQVHLRLS